MNVHAPDATNDTNRGTVAKPFGTMVHVSDIHSFDLDVSVVYILFIVIS